jgi:hypothetical protein
MVSTRPGADYVAPGKNLGGPKQAKFKSFTIDIQKKCKSSGFR